MALTKVRPSQTTRGIVAGRGGVNIGNGAYLFTGTAAPTDGTSGTGAGWAAPGSVYIRCSTTNSKIFVNTNTTASPTWTVVGAQTA